MFLGLLNPDPDPLVRAMDPGSESIPQKHGSLDPNPYQNVMDPQHWLKHWFCTVLASSVADPDPKSASFLTPRSGIFVLGSLILSKFLRAYY